MIGIVLLKAEIREIKKHIKNLENATLKENVKFSKEEIIRDFTLLAEFFQLALDDNIKEVYALLKDIEKILHKHHIDSLLEYFKLYKNFCIKRYKKMQN